MTSATACDNCDFDSYDTAYWSVGAPYQCIGHGEPKICGRGVIDYVKTQLRAQFAEDGMTADEASITSLALQEFPDEQMTDADDFNSQFSSYYLTDSDFDDLDAESSDVALDDVSGEAVESTVQRA